MNLAGFCVFVALAAAFAACSGLQVWAASLPAGINLTVFASALAVEAAISAAVLTMPINPGVGGKPKPEGN